ncbi:PorP/SprF family type IX secretion system membrane protein [Echinicola vietnamensis]|uniref:Bacteroidetes-specific putative membrane protein n=1 Tax=Echinicola vietnamensis (strain DSM 17526 / LMG 23754 / KMM 6221) TaxID=926556 RepID=L0FYP3_ECHVK|nr:type IX secretion system membrane protein PorP/SprF [Echinicola vietnamensis]AGA77765.1 Bacteroidetes-specific putative membrane protein [Echinicola vietnamensis DSM 17526]
MKKIFILSCFCIFAGIFFSGSEGHAQQLPQFSQYIFNGLNINPAYAGYKGAPYLQSSYRSQWSGFPGAPKTFSLSADLSANEGTMGFGASLLSDKLGPASTFSALLTYAYRLQMGYDSFLSVGVSGGVSEYAIDGTMFSPDEYNDPDIPEGKVNTFTPNLNTGVFFHTSRFYAGLSMFNLIGKKALEKESISLAYHDMHYYFTAGAMIFISDDVQFKPSVLIKEAKGSPTNYDINGMLLLMERLWLGASYRSNLGNGSESLQENLNNRNSIAAIVEIFATKQLRIGYSYDHNVNILSNLRNNSHEISVGYYIIPRDVRVHNPRWF